MLPIDLPTSYSKEQSTVTRSCNSGYQLRETVACKYGFASENLNFRLSMLYAYFSNCFDAVNKIEDATPFPKHT